MNAEEIDTIMKMWNRVFDSVMKFDERLTELIEEDEDDDFEDEDELVPA